MASKKSPKNQQRHKVKEPLFMRLIKKSSVQRAKHAPKLLFDLWRGKSVSYKRVLRTFFAIGSILAFFLWSGIHSLPPPLPVENQPPLLYASQCNDDLRKVFLSAIDDAKESIYLVIYSLTDEKILSALHKKASEGVAVIIVYDPSTPKIHIKRRELPIKIIPWKGSGLMHEKILVVDQKQVWVGSANMTTESLRLHDNNIVALSSSALAKAVEKREHLDLIMGGQRVEFWILPEEKKEALNKLISLIRVAKTSLKVAMFSWTHPQITKAVIEAHMRGVAVEAVIDHGQGTGASAETVEELLLSGIPVGLSQTELLHHKWALVDDKILITGSANWTRAAFSKNEECFLVIHDLTETQRKKVNSLWHAIRATRQLQNKKVSSIFLDTKAA